VINVVKLRVLAAEYVKEVSALLSNEFFITQKNDKISAAAPIFHFFPKKQTTAPRAESIATA